MGKKKEDKKAAKVDIREKAKVAAPKKAPAKRVAKKVVKATVKTVTPEERHKMIEQASYFRAERFGFQVDANENWVAAEAEVDAILAGKKS
ncbi:MAG: DUF2934 domain-containing protein [Lentisphaerota bacterium]